LNLISGNALRHQGLNRSFSHIIFRRDRKVGVLEIMAPNKERDHLKLSTNWVTSAKPATTGATNGASWFSKQAAYMMLVTTGNPRRQVNSTT
jgi:hypothetical protein